MLQRRQADCEENHDPGQHHRPIDCAQQGGEGSKAGPRSNQCAVVLGRIKAKPSVAAEEAASLDTPCARQRLDLAVGARESLRRGRTREMTSKERFLRSFARSLNFALAFAVAIRERLTMASRLVRLTCCV